MMTTIVEYDGEEDSEIEEPQPKKYENPTSNTDNTTNDSIYSCTSPARNINNGTKKVTNTETNTVTTNDGVNNREVAETDAKAEAEAATNSAKSNSSNNGIGDSSGKS